MYLLIDLWVKENGREKTLPGLGFTTRQLFWMSFARWQCTKYADEHLKWRIKHDVHAPFKYRTNGPLQNNNEFANDFDCKRGSGMNPEKKCNVW